MKTELEIANDRIKELEEIVKNLSSNLPVIKSLPSRIEIQKHAFEWRKRACYIGNYGLEKRAGMIAGGEWVIDEIQRRLGNVL